MTHQWHIHNDFTELSQAAADFIADKILQSIQQKNCCHIILPGGNTPALCLSLLELKPLPWEKIHWYLGDERCYPLGHTERNDVMLEKNLWSKLPVSNSHPIPAELGPAVGASVYRKMINDIEQFDIAFLGMGEDGHTASLFPGNKALHDERSVVAVYNSPKAPDERVSMGMNTLKNALCRIVLASGEGKADIISQIQSGDALPINSIGDIEWFVDKAAIRE